MFRRLLRRSIACLKNASKSSENLKTFVVKGLACGRDGSFILAEPFAMLGRAKCQSRMALRGAALIHFRSSRVDAVIPPRGGGEQGPLANVGYTERARSRVASGKQFSRGVDSNDKDLLWLLAPAKFDICGTGRCEAVTNQASFRTQSHLLTRGFASGSG